MRFLVRTASIEDLEVLLSLSEEGFLFNLPKKREALVKKIEKSQESFSGKTPKEEGEYLFVLEDLSLKGSGRSVVGSSQILASLGTPDRPFYCLYVSSEKKKNPFIDKEVEFQIFQIQKHTHGITEVGGLVVFPQYRGHKDKVGKLISFSRFLCMALMKERFQEKVIARMAPSLNDKEENAFWKAFGKCFTQLSYKQFLDIYLEGKYTELLHLFPRLGERIYACTLDQKGIDAFVADVKKKAYPAFSLLSRLGFRKSECFDIDGGVVVGASLDEIEIIKEGKEWQFKEGRKKSFFKGSREAFLGLIREGIYFGGKSVFASQGKDELFLPEETEKALKLSPGESLYVFEAD